MLGKWMREPEMLTVIDVARMLRCSRSKVYTLVERGSLPHYRIDGAIRISESDLLAYLALCRKEKGDGGKCAAPSFETLENLTDDPLGLCKKCCGLSDKC